MPSRHLAGHDPTPNAGNPSRQHAKPPAFGFWSGELEPGGGQGVAPGLGEQEGDEAHRGL